MLQRYHQGQPSRHAATQPRTQTSRQADLLSRQIGRQEARKHANKQTAGEQTGKVLQICWKASTQGEVGIGRQGDKQVFRQAYRQAVGRWTS